MQRSKALVLLFVAAFAACQEPTGFREYRHPTQGWSWRYPAAWHLQEFDDLIGNGSHIGAVLSSADHDFNYPDLGESRSTSAWDFADVPDDAVTLEFSRTQGISVPPCKRTTPTPLDTADLQPTDDRPTYGAPTREWMPICVRGRQGFVLHVWVGPEASQEDRAALEEVVASLELPPERPR